MLTDSGVIENGNFSAFSHLSLDSAEIRPKLFYCMVIVHIHLSLAPKIDCTEHSFSASLFSSQCECVTDAPVALWLYDTTLRKKYIC